MKNPLSSFKNYSAVNDSAKISRSSFRFQVSGFLLLLAICTANARAQQWIIDGKQTQVLKLEVTDPHAARNFGTNTVYFTTHAVARWVSLTNGLALEVWSESTTNWVRQVEYTED